MGTLPAAGMRVPLPHTPPAADLQQGSTDSSQAGTAGRQAAHVAGVAGGEAGGAAGREAGGVVGRGVGGMTAQAIPFRRSAQEPASWEAVIDAGQDPSGSKSGVVVGSPSADRVLSGRGYYGSREDVIAACHRLGRAVGGQGGERQVSTAERWSRRWWSLSPVWRGFVQVAMIVPGWRCGFQ